jgi:hypothetical protein
VSARRALPALAAALAAAGCAVWPVDLGAGTRLARADRLVAEREYRQAVSAYDEFLAQHASDGRVERARASRALVLSVLEAQQELERLRRELLGLRDDLARREGDVARLREELGRRQTEVERLRADLERLKELDLRLERRR